MYLGTPLVELPFYGHEFLVSHASTQLFAFVNAGGFDYNGTKVCS